MVQIFDNSCLKIKKEKGVKREFFRLYCGF